MLGASPLSEDDDLVGCVDVLMLIMNFVRLRPFKALAHEGATQVEGIFKPKSQV